jgi:hypothetical protein
MQQHGYIGANARRGFGRVAISAENAPDKTLYENYMKENKDRIVNFLEGLGALC